MRFESYIIIPKTLCIREPKRDKRIRVKPSIKINKIKKIKNKKKKWLGWVFFGIKRRIILCFFFLKIGVSFFFWIKFTT